MKFDLNVVELAETSESSHGQIATTYNEDWWIGISVGALQKDMRGRNNGNADAHWLWFSA